MTATLTKDDKATAKEPTHATDLTPLQAQEHLVELLELQAEEKELRTAMEKSHERYKKDKEAHDAKEAEIIRHLEGLNQELPLFDASPEDVPWPFPLASEDLRAARLVDVAADPVVLGLSIATVKATKEKLEVSTLGELERHLGGEKEASVDGMIYAKRELAKVLGPSTALKLLRGVHSFVGGRTAKAQTNGKKAKAEKNGKPAGEGETLLDPKPPEKPGKLWRGMPLQQIVGLHGFTQDMADKLQTVADITTVDGLLSKVDELKKGKKADSSPEYLENRLGAHTGMAAAMAKKMLDALWKVDEAIELAAQGEGKVPA